MKITSYSGFTSCTTCFVWDLKETCSKTIENVINRKFNGLMLNMEFISLARQFSPQYFHQCFALVKIWKILTHLWNQFHIERQTLEYPLLISSWNFLGINRLSIASGSARSTQMFNLIWILFLNLNNLPFCPNVDQDIMDVNVYYNVSTLTMV